MAALRRGCPWDAEQTHQSLLPYLAEEAAEVVEAVETGDDGDLCEELGDLLLQVYFHAEIARTQGRFTLEDVAKGICDKLIRRHPHVFAGEPVPEDKDAVWEAAKRDEKGRSSALQGIPRSLGTLVKAQKTVSRARAHRVEIDLPAEPISAADAGAVIVDVVCRAQASGVDADAAARAALRHLEDRIRQAEGA
ncbi:MAG: MazG nucleotide pyrophosphohydrolase domain-containing protein [Propionibacteriaceae bacterium]|nr:MazG nucleotide pyrophosphohydrolase domain-containing protein [Propionibacteriaceae bacterium]